MKNSILRASILGSAMILGSTGIAFAQTAPQNAPPATAQQGADQSGQAGSAEQIRQRLGSAGYTGIRDIERDDDRWKAHATNSAGQDVKLKLDANGNVVSEDVDD